MSETVDFGLCSLEKDGTMGVESSEYDSPGLVENYLEESATNIYTLKLYATTSVSQYKRS